MTLRGGNSNIFYFHPENWGRLHFPRKMLVFAGMVPRCNSRGVFFGIPVMKINNGAVIGGHVFFQCGYSRFR